MTTNAGFYQSLEPSSLPLYLLLQDSHFHPVPDDWFVVVADIRGSTAAVAAGKHNEVNLVAAGCLVAGLNVAQTHGLQIPFFFGGDGGTLIVPEIILEEVLTALRIHRSNTERNFGFSLHLGAVPLTAIRAAGHDIRLTKSLLGTGLSKAVLIGDGLIWAERQVKALDAKAEEAAAEKFMLDMMGLECRWDRIQPPPDAAEVVCYLVEAHDPSLQLEVYRDVLQAIDSIYGTPEKRNPLSMQRLKLLISMQKMRREVAARFGRLKWRYVVSESLKTLAGRFLLRNKIKTTAFDGKTYLSEVIANADTLTIDGRINTIISGTPDKRKRFLEYLDGEETKGRLLYGHHVARESVMTCYIQARKHEHVHFVDGSEGGYTVAAGELKTKRARR